MKPIIAALMRAGRPDLANVVAKAALCSDTGPFKVGDRVRFGKYKNKLGKILRFGRNDKGQVTVVIEPTPKGRKKDKEMGLFKIWTAPEAAAFEVKSKLVTNRKVEVA